MKVDRVINFFGTLITALAFASEVWYIKLFYRNIVDGYLLLSAFLICFGGYFYLRFTMYNKLNTVFFISVGITIFSGIMWYFHFKYLNKNISLSVLQILSLIVTGILLLMYHSKIFFNNIRNNVLMKPLIIAIVWMLLVFFYVGKFSWWIYFQQFIFIFLLTIPFDIKGLPTDKIITIPKVLGINKTKKLLAFLISMYFVTGLFLPKIYVLNSFFISCILLSLIFIDITYHKILVYIFYDGIIVLQALLLYFL